VRGTTEIFILELEKFVEPPLDADVIANAISGRYKWACFDPLRGMECLA